MWRINDQHKYRLFQCRIRRWMLCIMDIILNLDFIDTGSIGCLRCVPVRIFSLISSWELSFQFCFWRLFRRFFLRLLSREYWRWAQICNYPKFFAYHIVVNLPCNDRMYWHMFFFFCLSRFSVLALWFFNYYKIRKINNVIT